MAKSATEPALALQRLADVVQRFSWLLFAVLGQQYVGEIVPQAAMAPQIDDDGRFSAALVDQVIDPSHSLKAGGNVRCVNVGILA